MPNENALSVAAFLRDRNAKTYEVKLDFIQEGLVGTLKPVEPMNLLRRGIIDANLFKRTVEALQEHATQGAAGNKGDKNPYADVDNYFNAIMAEGVVSPVLVEADPDYDAGEIAYEDLSFQEKEQLVGLIVSPIKEWERFLHTPEHGDDLHAVHDEQELRPTSE